MLECRVYLGIAVGIQFVLPGRFVIDLFARIPTGEESFREIETFLDEERGVSMQADIICVLEVAAQCVMNQSTEKGNVGASPDGDITIGDGCGAVKSWIDANQLSLAVTFGFHHKAEADWMIFSRVAAHHQNHITIDDVGPTVGHGATAECGGQTGHRGAMSKSGLVFVSQYAQA